MTFKWLVCFYYHVTAVITNPDHKLQHRKTRGHFPVFEYLQDALMCGFIVSCGCCRTFAPGNDIFHDWPPLSPFCRASSRVGLNPRMITAQRSRRNDSSGVWNARILLQLT